MDEATKQHARSLMKGFCKVCPVCDGKACAGEVPGMGGTGTGAGFKENIHALSKVKVHMRTLHSHDTPDSSAELFGHKLAFPILAAPVGGVHFNMSRQISEEEYIRAVIEGALNSGTLAGTGDGEEDHILIDSLDALRQRGAAGIPFIKPWAQGNIFKKIDQIQEAGIDIFGMDIDAAGLITLKKMGFPVYPKSLEEIRAIADYSDQKFILKGIMTADQARIAADAGVDAIVVSNHGGRVLDSTPGTADVLHEIAQAVGDEITVLADGGIRSGLDVFKMLALGADAVLVGRPIAIAAIGGGAEAVRAEFELLQTQLEEVMLMTGNPSVEGIDTRSLFAFSD